MHEIFTVGPNFKAVTNFLWPFKLSAPKVRLRLPRSWSDQCLVVKWPGLGQGSDCCSSITLWAEHTMCPPQGGVDKKRLHFIEGGQAGNREVCHVAFCDAMRCCSASKCMLSKCTS